MATRKNRKKSRLDAAVIETEQGDFKRLLQHAQENTVLYLAGFGFLALCLIAGSLYRLNQDLVEEAKVTAYAAALGSSDPALRAAELERVATGTDMWSMEALYVMGETALGAREFVKAEEAFRRVVAEGGETAYAVRAADGLAFLMENSGDFEGALAGYQGVVAGWPNTFVARRQALNIGRVLESLDRVEEAIQSYRDQVGEFPGSNVAARATMALARLRVKHSDLFPALSVVGDVSVTEGVDAVGSSAESSL